MDRGYFYALGDDGDYVVLQSRDWTGDWIEHCRWLIPGTEFGE